MCPPLFVDVPFHLVIADGYINDIVTVMLDKTNWAEKGQNAAPLAVYTIFQPKNNANPIPRDDATSIRKHEFEGTLIESQNIPGWRVDTREFRIYLPKDKSLQ